MKTAACLVPVLALGVVAAAEAATTLVAIDPSVPYQTTVVPTPLNDNFVDRYRFDLDGPARFVAAVDFFRSMGVNRGAPYSLVDAQVEEVALYRSPDATLGDGNDVQLARFAVTRNDQPTWPFDYWEGHLTLSQPALVLDAGSDYYVQVSGWPAGIEGARYDIGVTVSAVPETASAALMVGGLAALGLLVRRRRGSRD